MVKIKEIKMTSPACPEQYEGVLENGLFFYIRSRFGMQEIRIGTEEQKDMWKMPTVAAREFQEDQFKGNFEDNELSSLMSMAGIELGDAVIQNDVEGRVKSVLQKIKDLKADSQNEDKHFFLTFDEDFLRGAVSTSMQLQVLAEMKARYPDVENVKP